MKLNINMRTDPFLSDKRVMLVQYCNTWKDRMIGCRPGQLSSSVNKTLDNIDVIAWNSLCVQHVIDLRHKDQLITILVLDR